MSIKELGIMVTIHKELHYGDDIERFYAKRKLEGRRLKQKVKMLNQKYLKQKGKIVMKSD